jgi:hypothetical protein
MRPFTISDPVFLAGSGATPAGDFFYVTGTQGSTSTVTTYTWATTPSRSLASTGVSGRTKGYVVKYDNTLTPVWAAFVRVSVGSTGARLLGSTVLADGSVIVSGTTSSGASNPTFSFENSDGTTTITLAITTTAVQTAWYAKIDKDGNWLWARGVTADDTFGDCDVQIPEAPPVLLTNGNVAINYAFNRRGASTMRVTNPTQDIVVYSSINSNILLTGILIEIDPVDGDFVDVVEALTTTPSSFPNAGLTSPGLLQRFTPGDAGYFWTWLVASGTATAGTFNIDGHRTTTVVESASVTSNGFVLGVLGAVSGSSFSNQWSAIVKSSLYPATARDINLKFGSMGADGSALVGGRYNVSAAQSFQASSDNFVAPFTTAAVSGLSGSSNVNSFYGMWNSSGTAQWLKATISSSGSSRTNAISASLIDLAGRSYVMGDVDTTAITVTFDNGLATQTSFVNATAALTTSASGYLVRIDPATGDVVWGQRAQARVGAATGSARIRSVAAPFASDKLIVAFDMTTRPTTSVMVIDPGAVLGSTLTSTAPTSAVSGQPYSVLCRLDAVTGAAEALRTFPDTISGSGITPISTQTIAPSIL